MQPYQPDRFLKTPQARKGQAVANALGRSAMILGDGLIVRSARVRQAVDVADEAVAEGAYHFVVQVTGRMVPLAQPEGRTQPRLVGLMRYHS